MIEYGARGSPLFQPNGFQMDEFNWSASMPHQANSNMEIRSQLMGL